MNNDMRKQMRQRDRLCRKMKHNTNNTNEQNYKNKRNEVVNLVREAKEQHIHRLQASLSDPNLSRKRWHMIAQEITTLKNKNTPPPPLINNGHVNIHPFEKAQTLNSHFANISRIENEPPIPNDHPGPNYSFKSINITQQDVKDQIRLFNISKPGGRGADEIMPRLIKIASKPLIEPLTQLLNKSVKLGKVPSQWKIANISVIFKGKGDEQDPMNYRPISVTSCLGKILGKIIFKCLFNYIQEHGIRTKF